MKLELEIDVPESREVTLTLPPEVPVGRTRVTVETPPNLPQSSPFAPSESLSRELATFEQLFPELLTTHREQYVAIYQGSVVGSGSDKLTVAREAYERFGAVPVLVRLVSEEQFVRHIRGPRRAPGEAE